MVTRREAALGLAAIASFSGAHSALANGDGPTTIADPSDPFRYVDPELRAFLRTLPPAKAMTAEDVKQLRQNPDQQPIDGMPAGVVSRLIRGTGGGPDVRIFIVGRSGDGRSRPGLL